MRIMLGMALLACLLCACGDSNGPSALSSTRSVGTLEETQPTCIDVAGDGACDQCQVRFVDEPGVLPFAGPPCRFFGKAYDTGLSCGYGAQPFSLGWVRDGDLVVLFFDEPEMYFVGSVSNEWDANLLSWRAGSDDTDHPIDGFMGIRSGGQSFEFFITSLPDFSIEGCETTTLRSSFDEDADVDPRIEERAGAILAQLRQQQ